MTNDPGVLPAHESAEGPHPARGGRYNWFTRLRNSRTLARIVWTAEQLGKLGIVVTIINYFLEAPDRLKSKEFQAWQLVNSARTGDGGRKLALHDLIQDGVDLSGLDLNGANLLGADLRGGELSRVSFVGASLGGANFSCMTQGHWPLVRSACKTTMLDYAKFSAPIRVTSFRGAVLSFADFSAGSSANSDSADDLSLVDFSGARLSAATFHEVKIWDCRFLGAVLGGARFLHVDFLRTSFDRANFRHSGPGSHVVFKDASFTEVSFQQADLTGIELVNAVMAPLAEKSLQAIIACGPEGACVPKSRLMIEDDLKGAILCNTKINGVKSDRDCAKSAAADDKFH